MKNNTNNSTNEMISNNFTLPKYEKAITVYSLPDGFIVEVEKGSEYTDFYISHRNYGVKSLMFGLCNCDIGSEEEIILANAEECMDLYREEFMDF